MKFLVLALCVCAASAASFGSTPFGAGGYKNFKGFQNPAVAPAVVAAKTVVAPAVFAAKTAAAVSAPVATPVASAAAATYEAGSAAASATYQTGSAAYQTAKQVVNKPYSAEGDAAIVRSESDVSADGFKFAYETANGISAESVGTYKQIGESGAIVTNGAYRYTDPEGKPVLVTYIADENGYQPQSDSLPVGPEIPEAILRSLAYIAARSKETVQKY